MLWNVRVALAGKHSNESTKILQAILHKTISGLTITYALSTQQLRLSFIMSEANVLFQRKLNQVIAAACSFKFFYSH